MRRPAKTARRPRHAILALPFVGERAGDMDAAVVVGELLPARLTFDAQHEAVDEGHAHADRNPEVEEFAPIRQPGRRVDPRVVEESNGARSGRRCPREAELEARSTDE